MPKNQPVISLNKATKLYGQQVGAKNVSLTIEKGSIVGFLGPNGAGKSTTINMIINLLKPTSGSIRVFGMDSVDDSLDIRRRIGFLTGDIALDRGLTGWQQLKYFGNLHGTFNKTRITELAKRLDCNLNKKFKTLSRGNKQKVGLIAALMHEPDLLIFDEPTSGLDPLIQAEFNKIILEEKERGATVFVSSHILSEVQEICDRVVFIRQGRIVADKTMVELSKQTFKNVTITGASKPLRTKLSKLKHVHKGVGEDVFTFHYSGDINALLLVMAGYKVGDVTIERPDLEETFMTFYGDGGNNV